MANKFFALELFSSLNQSRTLLLNCSPCSQIPSCRLALCISMYLNMLRVPTALSWPSGGIAQNTSDAISSGV